MGHISSHDHSLRVPRLCKNIGKLGNSAVVAEAGNELLENFASGNIRLFPDRCFHQREFRRQGRWFRSDRAEIGLRDGLRIGIERIVSREHVE